MAKVFRCKELGMPCDFEARAETEEELVKKCTEHARVDHGITEITPQLEAMARAVIRHE